jgi:hypothetical protein
MSKNVEFWRSLLVGSARARTGNSHDSSNGYCGTYQHTNFDHERTRSLLFCRRNHRTSRPGGSDAYALLVRRSRCTDWGRSSARLLSRGSIRRIGRLIVSRSLIRARRRRVIVRRRRRWRHAPYLLARGCLLPERWHRSGKWYSKNGYEADRDLPP